jgi:hypothetical protein
MSIAVENLPLPRRDISRKKLPRRCHDGFQKNLSNLTVETILGQKY